MSLGSHVAELNARHAQLDAEIAEELAHAACDDLKVARLKRQKLKIKEQIARLSNQANTRH